MATIRARTTKDGTTHYHVQVRLKGCPTQTASFERRTDAKLWVQQTEAAIREGRHFKTSEAKRHTLAELIDRYLRDVLPRKAKGSQDAQGGQLAWWKKKLGRYSLAEITTAKIVECRDSLAKESTSRADEHSAATVNRYLAALSHAFTVAVKEWHWAQSNPVSNVSRFREPRGRVRFLSDDERTRLLRACEESRNPCLHDVVILALSTGMRRNEVMHLEWKHVDLQRGLIVLEETKNGERRAVPLVGRAHSRLAARSKIRRLNSPYVFPAPYQSGATPKPIDIQSAWKAALDRAELDDFRFHDLRHSTASYLAMNGASLAEIAEILGHKTLQMVRRYTHLSQSHTSEVLRRMNERVLSESAS